MNPRLQSSGGEICPHLCPQTVKDTPMKLTDAQLRNLSEHGKHFDGGGLYLELTKPGGVTGA